MRIHQGDVLLVPAVIPTDSRMVRREVVAFGEVTGHAHRIVDALFYVGTDGKNYLRVPKTQPMTHEEHPAVEVPAKDYEVIIQKEYFPQGFKTVKD